MRIRTHAIEKAKTKAFKSVATKRRLDKNNKPAYGVEGLSDVFPATDEQQ